MIVSAQHSMQALRRSEIQLQRRLRRHVTPEHSLWLFLRHAHRLVEDMNSFCQHLRAYVLLEVVEGAWADLLTDVDKARLPPRALQNCTASSGRWVLHPFIYA